MTWLATYNSLATVAKTGDFSDVKNKPTTLSGYGITNALTTSYVPTWSSISGKPTFSTVATSGSYNDLTNKPAAYTLPIATTTVLGGVKAGSNVTIDVNGVISVAAPITSLPFSSITSTPTSISGYGISLQSTDITGALGFTPYNSTNPNGYQTAAQVSSAITAASYSLPVATSTILGGVKQGSNVTIDANGVISVAAPVTSLPFSSITSKPTTLSGYGITLYASDVPTLNQNTTGNAATATTASTANALNTANNYQVNSLGVGTAPSGVAGEIRAIGNITGYYSSDFRLKENITPIANALDKVNVISGNWYEWTQAYMDSHGGEDGYFIRRHDVGVIAQEIEQVLPEAVVDREDGYKAVNYEKIIPLLIQAIKELKSEVDSLKNSV